ncbi:MAG TPA: hypothetical protein VFN96_05895, partial [Gemmatimonadales bacterium]|nr:hypothetical protein [Gemmatimonadales bacterium]
MSIRLPRPGLGRSSRRAALLLAAIGAGACRDRPAPPPEFGVSLDLARERAARISDLRYTLAFAIPDERTAPVTGRAAISLTLADTDGPLVLDFRGDSASVADLVVNGDSIVPELTPVHVVIPASALKPGPNTVSLRFTAADEALNRQDEFLYALFVPDRASTAFPCFDQPDLKA